MRSPSSAVVNHLAVRHPPALAPLVYKKANHEKAVGFVGRNGDYGGGHWLQLLRPELFPSHDGRDAGLWAVPAGGSAGRNDCRSRLRSAGVRRSRGNARRGHYTVAARHRICARHGARNGAATATPNDAPLAGRRSTAGMSPHPEGDRWRWIVFCERMTRSRASWFRYNDRTRTPAPNMPEISDRVTDQSPLEIASGMAVAQAILKPRKARPFFGRHPWVLDSAIDRVEGDAADGDVVELLNDRGKFIARGIFNSRSRIRVRLYTWDAGEPLDDAFWQRRLTTAVEFRRQLGYLEPSNACRLVFSEADGLSGLIVDRYADYLAIQPTALALARRLDLIVPVLRDLVKPRGIVIRNERGVTQLEGVEAPEGLFWGEAPQGPIFITEHGIRYGVDLTTGQKTGFYVDQRDNRRRAAEFCRDRHVLDMFCYSGGFALAASVLGGARDVVAIDTSEKAIALARANAELNGIANVHFRTGDAFDALDQLVAEGKRFGVVILDPPKFARSRARLNEALMAYHRINSLAVLALEPGGILVTCSCSGHVMREDFLHMLSGVAQRTHRLIQVLEQRGAATDHPVSATCVETEYLKCFICRVA
jgi:23S rRNA (cytosine1962-C5)-methyltransferase